MDVEISKIKEQLKSHERRIENSEKLCSNLNKMSESMVKMATDMEYVRKDVNKIKEDNTAMQKQLDNHEKHSIGVKADKYDYYIKEVVKWVIILILGATIGSLF